MRCTAALPTRLPNCLNTCLQAFVPLLTLAWWSLFPSIVATFRYVQDRTHAPLGSQRHRLPPAHKERGGPAIQSQLLFYPVTDVAFETPSYHQFAEGYFLRRDAMMWFWDQYTTDPEQRNEITASPLCASLEQL